MTKWYNEAEKKQFENVWQGCRKEFPFIGLKQAIYLYINFFLIQTQLKESERG